MTTSADGAEVVQAIRKILNGGAGFDVESVPDVAGHPQLSARELDVLRHLGRGLSNQELGRVLGISETTVKAHSGPSLPGWKSPTARKPWPAPISSACSRSRALKDSSFGQDRTPQKSD